jgi:hypothetical protein
MARRIHRLSPASVKNAPVGMHADGGGLYLQVMPSGDDAPNKSWIFRFAIAGRERHMGLGSLQTVGLSEARQRAGDARKLREQGIDPIAARDESRAAAAALNAKQSMTFDACRDAYIAAHRSGWRNVKHAGQWQSALTTYATPFFGKVSVREIDTGLVMRAIEPLWTTKTETAARLRGRIESILDWAKVRGFREGDKARASSMRSRALNPNEKRMAPSNETRSFYGQQSRVMRACGRQDPSRTFCGRHLRWASVR